MELRFHDDNLGKHNVTPSEVEEALNDSEGWTERTKNDAYLSVGKTFGGRFLEICYRKLPEGHAFVFHAMDARDHQKKRYNKRI
jgi:hypothetical protein